MSDSMMLSRGLLSEKGAARPSSFVSSKVDLHDVNEESVDSHDVYVAANPGVTVSGLTGLIKRRTHVQNEDKASSVHHEETLRKPINHPSERPYWLAPLRNKVAATMKTQPSSQVPQPQPTPSELETDHDGRAQIRRQMTVRLDMLTFERMVGIAQSDRRTYQDILEEAVLNYLQDTVKSCGQVVKLEVRAAGHTSPASVKAGG